MTTVCPSGPGYPGRFGTTHPQLPVNHHFQPTICQVSQWISCRNACHCDIMVFSSSAIRYRPRDKTLKRTLFAKFYVTREKKAAIEKLKPTKIILLRAVI